YAGQNVGYQNGYNAVQNVGNQVVQDAVGVQNVGNQNGQIVVPGITNQNPNGNGNVVAARAEGNATGNNGNQIRCYNCRGLGHLARNCTVRPRRRDAAYLQTQLLIAQKEEAGIQLQAEEFDLMAAAADLDEIEEVNANCILMANLQKASTSGTQTDKAPVYDSDGSAECGTRGGIVDQHPATVEETRAYFESLYNNLALEVEKVNSVNRKMKETNADLTTELARYKNQEKCFEISQEKYDKLERCYQKSVYQEQCLTKKINALHLSSVQNVGNQVVQDAVQNQGVQNVGNQNGQIVVPGITNQNPNGNGNVVAARAEGNATGNNGNQIRCYNCRGLGHLARNCTVRPRRRDAAYLQTQLLIAQKEEAGIQLQAEEFDLMAAAADLDEIEEVNANCILMANLQQASTSGTQTDKAPVYDSDGSAEVHNYDNCYDNEIFNMFTQEEQYTDLLEPIPEPHQVQQNDSNVISEISSVEQEGGTVDQHPATVEETRAYFESLYNNLALEVEKVNSVNRKMKETNADLTTELARYKNQEKCFEISQAKYDKLERCYQKSVYQEQCLTKKINALHLSSGKQITTLNEEISNLSKQLSTEKSTVSSLLQEKKKLKSDFKIREDELLDKQIQLENKIKELDNILVKMGQSIQTMHMLSPKPDSFYHTEHKMALGYQNPFYLKQAQQEQQSLYNGKVLLEKHDPPVVYDSEETLEFAQESRLKMKQLNKEIKPANYTKINHLSGVFVSQTAKSQEEVYVVNTSKTATVSKSISKPNEEFLDDTTLSVARKFLNEVKSTIVTLQRVVKHRMTLDTHNWSSSAHQEIHKILKEEIFPIINQVDSRLQNFEIQFLKEAAKFVRDFKSLAKEADESLAKHKTLELEIERLLRAVVSQDIMSIVQNPSVVDSSNLQTELDRTKERLENCIIKKENEYAKLWNDWYKKCEECKYDKISYDKAYNDMQQKIERLQAQLGDQKGKSKDTPSVSNTLDPLS
ncbi:retrovirus-related pol polyprotein from transposon TNT 1-94, partial [Tanacetum coccineum]